jgi:hypothetical protein
VTYHKKNNSMNELSHIPSEFSKEFSVDAKGKVTASRKAICRLTGISPNAIRKLLARIAEGNHGGSRFLEPFARKDFGEGNLPDVFVAAIISYYAYEAGRYCTEQAKDVAFTFQAIGFRAWVQQELGWKSNKGESHKTTFRLEGKETRRDLTDAVKSYIDRHKDELSENAIKWMYTNMTNGLYLKTHKLKASQLIEIHGCGKDELRDHFSKKEISMINAVEFVTMQLIDEQDMNPIEAIKSAVERTLATHLFAAKYTEEALKLKSAK